MVKKIHTRLEGCGDGSQVCVRFLSVFTSPSLQDSDPSSRMSGKRAGSAIEQNMRPHEDLSMVARPRLHSTKGQQEMHMLRAPRLIHKRRCCSQPIPIKVDRSSGHSSFPPQKHLVLARDRRKRMPPQSLTRPCVSGQHPCHTRPPQTTAWVRRR